MELELRKEFQARFHQDPEHVYFCPGRVNLIGEHIDYNGGKVMPCAISLGIWMAVSRNTDKRLRFFSLNYPEHAEFHLQDSYTKSGKAWFNYPLGVVNELASEGHAISGLNIMYAADLPAAAGLSSSACLEVVTAFALVDMFGMGISKPDIALLAKKVENEFIGVNCGIMDQFAVAMGKQGHALLLDCDTLEYEYLPFDLGEYVLAIINSNKSRELAESAYNERFIECGKALTALKQGLKVQNLCEIAPDEFLVNKHLINDPILEKRALHVVLENERVKQAAIALKKNDLPAFGKLMFASHTSLEELYEVSGNELDTIVAFCCSYDGCIGARMTGAGFGGCAIALVKRDKADDFATQLTSHYKEKIGYAPDVFASRSCDGVKELKS